jgi:hypothetical protein
MNLPSLVSLRLTCPTAANLADLIVGMKITAGHKNPYYINFPKTDALGRSAISEASIRGQFEDHWAEGLMDYSGTLATASQRVIFHLFDPAAMRRSLAVIRAWPLLPYETTVWCSRQEFIDYHLSSRNEQFQLVETAVVLPETGEVNLAVARHGV